tara:strand:+ start:712 stop:1068 length:357 start_codon:yes stop_codon:yes gene_type:complete
MSTLNRVTLLGNLGGAPELRYTQSGNSVCSFSIATTEKWSKDDEKREKTQWHKIVVWGKQGENCAKYLRKGRSVLVEGKLESRSWEDKEGNKKYSVEIIASNVVFVGSQKNGGSESSK